jgi:hypothetical protein
VKTTVSGTVTLDGNPMPEGEILFAGPGEVPQVLDIKNGSFEGQVTVGTKRVEIRAYRQVQAVAAGGMYKGEEVPGGGSSKENYLPARFNSESELTAEVTASGPNKFSFPVTSK